ncbi:unnamed protein product [Ilex paraguariensis]|uniref:Uncharacterized protein n=1 Tax=Ilex paraguariensis TaxID=185542 RepID=A0ABC8R804_9AQUA
MIYEKLPADIASRQVLLLGLVPASITSISVSQAGVTLTPELIATLSFFLPAKEKFSLSESAQPIVGSSTLRPLLTSTVVPHNGGVSSKPLANFAIPASAQFAVSPQLNHQHQQVMLQDSQTSNGMGYDTGGFTLQGSTVQQPLNAVTLPNVVHGSSFSEQHTVMPVVSDQVNLDVMNQVQQLQSAPYGSDQGTSEFEDKNKRYRSTLQLVANLLFQIKQQ